MLHYISIGCKVNQAEMAVLRHSVASEQRRMAEIKELDSLSRSLLSSRFRGNDKRSGNNNVRVCVLNTCAVTATAEAKSRKLIRRFIRENPDSRLIVTGCLAQAKPEEVRKIIRKGDMVVGNKEKGGIAEMVLQLKNLRTEERKNHSETNRGSSSLVLESFSHSVCAERRTRAFVKIQDGCNNFCSYCIVPFLRSEMWSKPLNTVDKEIRELVDKGYKEVVLTGINLGKHDNLVGLLKRLLKIDGLKRLRLSSIELEDVSAGLIDLMVGAPLAVAQDKRAGVNPAPTTVGNPAICPHLHIPLQSGSDRILKLMKRHYSSGDFIERINLLKRWIENPAITTDIIVGFPGETDADFQQTLTVCKEVGFSKIHIFPFSPREGTNAFGMTDKVKADIIKNRFNLLNNLARELSLRYKHLFLGKLVDVLVEDNKEGFTPHTNALVWGFTDRYIKVGIKPGGKPKPNQIVKVKITGIKPDYVTGIATNPLTPRLRRAGTPRPQGRGSPPSGAARH
ncbi:MAG TPA: MiaB/RimO family radical SAM methylthiotransferase [Planctomycetota bacterium]|nr:MiaB/RimO family radical SAM methylthiotransferase [Planctomycetota bacterium]